MRLYFSVCVTFGMLLAVQWNVVTFADVFKIEYQPTSLDHLDDPSIQMNLRRMILQEQCKNSTRNINKINRNYLFGYQNLIYCAIPKVGSTTWKKLLVLMNKNCQNCSSIKDINKVHSMRNYYWDIYKSYDTKYVLDKSHKMVIVREPYSRLLSAYVNKVFIPVTMEFWKSTWQYVKRKRPVKVENCVDFTFPEIVRFVIDAIKTNTLRNNHFETMNNICKPCDIQYDTIIKMETFNRDTIYMLNTLNKSDVYNKSSTLDQHSMEANIIEHINNIFKKDTGLCQSKAERIRRLWRSFQIRGFIGYEVKYSLSKEVERNISSIELINFVLRATKERKSADYFKNKELALIEAYSTIPYVDLEELSEIFKQDCNVFGYDCRPDILFNREKYPPSTNFFDVWF